MDDEKKCPDRMTLRDTIKAADGLVTHHTRRFLAISVVVTMELMAAGIMFVGLKLMWGGALETVPLVREVFLLLFGAASGAMATYGLMRAKEESNGPK